MRETQIAMFAPSRSRRLPGLGAETCQRPGAEDCWEIGFSSVLLNSRERLFPYKKRRGLPKDRSHRSRSLLLAKQLAGGIMEALYEKTIVSFFRAKLSVGDLDYLQDQLTDQLAEYGGDLTSEEEIAVGRLYDELIAGFQGTKQTVESILAKVRSKFSNPALKEKVYKTVSALLLLTLAACAVMPAGAVGTDIDRPIQPTIIVQESPTAPVTQEAPAETPQVEATAEVTPEATPESPYGNWTAAEAITVRTRLTETQIEAKLEEIRNYANFPLVLNPNTGAYYQLCLLENISFLKQGNYIEFGNYAVRATGQCSYLDVNRERQTVTIALVVQYQDENAGSTWWPAEQSIAPGTARTDDLVQQGYELFWNSTGKPGDVIGLSFGPEGAKIRFQYLGGQHHADLLAEIYTPEQLQEYTETGDPSIIDDLLVPVYIDRSQTFNTQP